MVEAACYAEEAVYPAFDAAEGSIYVNTKKPKDIATRRGDRVREEYTGLKRAVEWRTKDENRLQDGS